MPGSRAATAALLLFLLTGVRADMRETPPNATPGLRISRMSGSVEIEPEAKPAAALPYLRTGSIVRVLSGSAAFDSDFHATVRAGEGDVFRFIAIPPRAGKAGILRITALETEPKSLEVAVGAYKFRLRKGGALSITAAWPGERIIKADGRGVEFAPGSAAPDGSLMARGKRLEAGQAVSAAVPEATGFDDRALDVSAVIVDQARGGSFTASFARKKDPVTALREAQARDVIADWPLVSVRTAEVVMEKYGPPELALSDRLSWFNNGPWRITTVYRDPRARLDVLEQTIGYRVPKSKADALARLDVGLRLSRDNKELSATSDAEETNFLALNLADEVVRELKSPSEARDEYLKTVVRWNAGKTSPFMKGLLFR